MTVQAQLRGSRLLLILALVAAPFVSILAVQWEIWQRNVVYAVVTCSDPQYLAPVGSGDGVGDIDRQDLMTTLASSKERYLVTV
jgi:hypothetical protein